MDWNSTGYMRVCSCLPVLHCRDKFVYRCNLANNIGEGAKSIMGIMNTDVCILLPVKVFFSLLFSVFTTHK
jgi:hypothetical protein